MFIRIGVVQDGKYTSHQYRNAIVIELAIELDFQLHVIMIDIHAMHATKALL